MATRRAIPVDGSGLSLDEAVERRIEGSGLDFQQVVGLGADSLSNSVSVARPPLEGPQDEHVERSLEELQTGFVLCLGIRWRAVLSFVLSFGS